MSENGILHMARIHLDARRLAQLAERQGLTRGHEDVGFLVHAQLAALFGEGVIRPFRPVEVRDRVEVLGYSRRDAAELTEHARRFADPADHAACAWDGVASKPMPRSWNGGERLGFEVRVCPVVRLARATATFDRTGRAVGYARGAEIDAWVHGRWMVPDGAGDAWTRETAYAAWLAQRLSGAAKLESSALTAFRRVRLVRRSQGPPRRSKILERPDAVLRGVLVVEDAERFQGLLAGGVGRHTGFGFGMLLLRASG